MRYMGLQVYALVALTACAGAQAAPTTAATPTTATRERAVSEQERAARAAERAERVQQRTAQMRIRTDSMRVRAQAQRLAADSALMNRATLGITLGPTGNPRDTLGIFVSAVVPGGPAEQAGIYEGDRIASINGVDVRTQASDAGDSYLSGVAQRRLTLELRKLTPGQRASVRVWSGGRYKDVQVTTGRYAEVYRNRRTQIRIGGDAPLVIPDVRVVPMTPGRTMMYTPAVPPVPAVPAAPAVPALPGTVQLELPDADFLAEVAARAVAELPEAEIRAALASLAELEGELLSDVLLELPFDLDFDVQLDAPIEQQLDIELEAELPSADGMVEITQEALRQAHETLTGLETYLGLL